MINYIVDTHSHIDMIESISLDEIIVNAENAMVKKIIIPCAYPHDIEKINQLTLKNDKLFGLLGVHPSEARDWDDSLIEQIKTICSHNNKIVGIGEIGLDYYWDISTKELQARKLPLQTLHL